MVQLLPAPHKWSTEPNLGKNFNFFLNGLKMILLKFLDGSVTPPPPANGQLNHGQSSEMTGPQETARFLGDSFLVVHT